MTTIHFTATVTDSITNWAACGEIIHPLLISKKMTDDKAEVTCKRCLKTFNASQTDQGRIDRAAFLEEYRLRTLAAKEAREGK
jgi:hypothetical protein